MGPNSSAALKYGCRQVRSEEAHDLVCTSRRWNRAQGRGLILIAGGLFLQSAYPQTASLPKDSFESGTIQSSIWQASDTEGCSASVKTGDAADGTHYMRSALTAKPGGGNYRCEQSAKGVGISAKPGVPYYYAMAFRVPSDFAYDSQSGETIMQLHHQPTSGSHSHHAVRINDRNLEWKSHGDAGGPTVNLAPLARGQWTRVCVRAVWTTDDTGSLKVWLNPSSESSSPVFQWSGRTLPLNYTNVGKFKVGIYKPNWRTVNFPTPFNSATSPRIVEHDDVGVGLSFADACGGASQSQPPDDPAPQPPNAVAVE
jgi:hypothetical protein